MKNAQAYVKQVKVPPVIITPDAVRTFLQHPELAPGIILAHDPLIDLISMHQAIEYSGRHPSAMHVFESAFGNVEWFARLTPSDMYQRIVFPKQEKVLYFRFDETTHTVPYTDLAYFAAQLARAHPVGTIEIQSAFSHTLTSKRFFDMYQADKVMGAPVVFCKTTAKELEELVLPNEDMDLTKYGIPKAEPVRQRMEQLNQIQSR